MSKQYKNLPLKNITALFNTSMSHTNDSRYTSLTDSPLSSLAFTLSELSTGRNSPKLRRKLSMSSLDTPLNDSTRPGIEASLSSESGCFSESPLVDSPTLDSLSVKRYTTAFHPDIPLEAFSVKKKTIAFRRINSQPLPTMRLDSPTDFLEEVDNDADDTIICENDENGHSYRKPKLFSDDGSSQDSGLGFEQDARNSSSSIDSTGSVSSSITSLNHLDRLPSLEDLWNSMLQDSPGFKTPKGMPPKRSRSQLDDKQYSEETCSPTKYSPVKTSSLHQPSFSKNLFCSQIPEATNEASYGSQPIPDDGFQELFQLNDIHSEGSDKVSSLISATLLHKPLEDKADEVTADLVRFFPKKRVFDLNSDGDMFSSQQTVSRRGLYRSHSLDIRPRSSFKRCEPPSDGSTPVHCKRWRGDNISKDETRDTAEEDCDTMMMRTRRLQRCHSETEAIKSAVSRMFLEPDLIGDCSKAYCLPTVSGKHQDLKSITPETLSRLLADEFSDVVEEFHVIDCRYPYEYDGGHIQNAINIYTKDHVIEKYLKKPLAVKDPNKRIILVFHCEFSSERGPGLFRFLRRQDRQTNKEFYPFLHYPEIYLLDGGYKSFFEHFPHLCVPRNYKTMIDKNHSDDLRKFRAKSKSWLDDRSQPRPGVRNIKF